MSVNVTDRPMTGQGVMGMKSSAGGGGRLVEDTSYYVGLLRKKMKVCMCMCMCAVCVLCTGFIDLHLNL
jgi:hypothetical protein